MAATPLIYPLPQWVNLPGQSGVSEGSAGSAFAAVAGLDLSGPDAKQNISRFASLLGAALNAEPGAGTAPAAGPPVLPDGAPLDRETLSQWLEQSGIDLQSLLEQVAAEQRSAFGPGAAGEPMGQILPEGGEALPLNDLVAVPGDLALPDSIPQGEATTTPAGLSEATGLSSVAAAGAGVLSPSLAPGEESPGFAAPGRGQDISGGQTVTGPSGVALAAAALQEPDGSTAGGAASAALQAQMRVAAAARHASRAVSSGPVATPTAMPADNPGVNDGAPESMSLSAGGGRVTEATLNFRLAELRWALSRAPQAVRPQAEPVSDTDDGGPALAVPPPPAAGMSITPPPAYPPPASGASQVAAAPSLQMTQPLPGNGWQDEFSGHVALLVKQGLKDAELRLNPPQLGPIKIQLNVHQDQANIVFTSQHAVVREAIEAAMPRLREMLADAGITLNDAQVDDQGRAFGHDQRGYASGEAAQGHGRGPLEEDTERDSDAQPPGLSARIQNYRLVDYFA